MDKISYHRSVNGSIKKIWEFRRKERLCYDRIEAAFIALERGILDNPEVFKNNWKRWYRRILYNIRVSKMHPEIKTEFRKYAHENMETILKSLEERIEN